MNQADALNPKNAKATTAVTCPECGKKSKHSTFKIHRRQALLCPPCKSLVVMRTT